MQVDFTHKNGKVQPMQKRFADILQKLGRGTYETRMLTAAPQIDGVNAQAFAGSSDPRTIADVDAEIKAANDLESLDTEALHALAKQMDLKVHHKAGADKVRAAIEDARKAQQ